jgi:small metal-binding protein
MSPKSHNLEEEKEMKRNIAAAAFIVGAVSLFGVGISSATEPQEEPQEHVAKALTYAHTAVNEGQKKDPAIAVEQNAKQALEHAKQAEHIKPDPHITEAETHLNQAIDTAAAEQADIATKHVQEAIRHLQMAYQGTRGK